MLKKTLFAMLAMLAISIPAQSIELPAGATPTFEKSPTAYSTSYKFDNLMAAYGLSLDPAAVSGVPSSYAKISGDKVVLNNDPIAYSPAQYHDILTAYGLELTPEAVNEKLGASLHMPRLKMVKLSLEMTLLLMAEMNGKPF